MKKLISLILCLMMVLSFAAPAFAADPTYTLTINHGVSGHTYEAYQIFSGDLETIPNTTTQVLTNIEWGSSITNGAALLEAITEAASEADPSSKFYKLATVTSAEDLADAIADNIGSDSSALDQLAVLFAQYLGTPVSNSTDAEGNSTFNEAAGTYTISNLPAGYYLIKDKDESLEGALDSYTKYMLYVLKNETVSPKSEVPSVDKQINDTIDGTFTEHEDFDINDTVFYKWTGHLPTNLDEYKVYFYKFIDTLPKGIQNLQFEQIYIEGHDGNRVHTFLDLHDEDTTNDTLPVNILNADDPSIIDASIAQNVTNNADGTTKVELTFSDLFKLYPHILNTHMIVVKYSARVTRDAVYAEPMTNKVYVEYSNNPNDDQGGDHGKTPEDVAHAFTFKISVDKYDADNESKKLEGAEFVLYYQRINTETNKLENWYAQVVTEEAIANGEGINGKVFTTADLGVVYAWTTDRNQASILDTDATGALNVRGLDADTYYLEETKAPAGYNLMEDPVKIEIIPAYTENGDEVSVTVNYKVNSKDQTDGIVHVSNSTGSTLPSTGGVGTTMFYVFGGIMVVAAVVLLVTKKRMAA
ncbi:MAG: SpaH/EbpB family LPXTG-anchored major pilin [Oscillospiraceae bacterium]|nr:SpaH/EbpB family LPXTG-anchored major pilin [Oscillospiraceae bacterium]